MYFYLSARNTEQRHWMGHQRQRDFIVEKEIGKKIYEGPGIQLGKKS